MIAGVTIATHRHFRDPAFIGYTIGVYVGIQVAILLPALALAFITRRKIWSGVLFAIGLFCLLAITDLVKLLLPGVAHPLAWCIGLLAAFQVARAVNRHPRSRFVVWMVAAPALIALCALAYGPAREASQRAALPPPPNSPNVLVIIVDTLRADHLSPYGYTRDTSPYITHLAQQGVLFENAIAPSSWTLPSHASILTGLYPHQTRVETESSTLSGTIPTLGEALQKRGYRTAAFAGNFLFFSSDRGFARNFSHFEEYGQSIGAILEKVPLSRTILQSLSRITTGDQLAFFGIKNAPDAEKINENTLKWIGKGGRPFFVAINYFDVHEPALPPEPYLHMYTSDSNARNDSMHFGESCSYAEAGPMCASERPQLVAVYDGAIRYTDESIQHLLSQLLERGLLQNTIVVFTSDHGQEFGDHGIYGHEKSLYRGEIQVPLILWKPGLVPANVRVPTPVSLIDIPATILDLITPGDKQADGPPMPGRSLAALWSSGQPVSGWPHPASELAKLPAFDQTAPNFKAPVETIVTPEWQYIRQQGKDLLFDWKTDPDEAHDLSAAHPAECAAFRAQIQAAEASRPQAH
jgi:arylsulfatase A-like enzyme